MLLVQEAQHQAKLLKTPLTLIMWPTLCRVLQLCCMLYIMPITSALKQMPSPTVHANFSVNVLCAGLD